MSARRLPSPLLVVTDRHGPRPLADTAAACLAGGARWIWFRDRDMERVERRRCGERLRDLVRNAGGVLTVGGSVDLAEELGADGVHLGGGRASAVASARNRLGAAALIGISAHSLAEIDQAARAGADYVTLSPIFSSASKPGYGPALGLSGIDEGARAGLPVVALGGMTADRAAACRRAGSAGFAVMGALMRATDPSATVRRLLAAWNETSPP